MEFNNIELELSKINDNFLELSSELDNFKKLNEISKSQFTVIMITISLLLLFSLIFFFFIYNIIIFIMVLITFSIVFVSFFIYYFIKKESFPILNTLEIVKTKENLKKIQEGIRETENYLVHFNEISEKNKSYEFNRLKEQYIIKLNRIKLEFKKGKDIYKAKLEQEKEQLNNRFKQEQRINLIIRDYMEVLKHYNIKISRSFPEEIQNEILSANDKTKKRNLMKEIDKIISKNLGIGIEIVQLLYLTFYQIEGNKEIWNKIGKDEKKLIEIYKIINKNIHFQNYNLFENEAIQILRAIDEFDLLKISNKINLYIKLKFFLEKTESVLQIFNIPNYKEKILPKLLEQEIDLNEIVDLFSKLIIIIFDYSMKYNRKDPNIFGTEFQQTCLFFIWYYNLKEYYPESFLSVCKMMSNEAKSIKIIWKIFKTFPNFESFIQSYLKQDLSIESFLDIYYSSEKLEKVIPLFQTFKDNLLKGKIIIEEKILNVEYFKDIESRCEYLDYLFGKFGDIDYQYIHRAIFKKNIHNESLIKIILAKQDYIPFLITFDKGVQKFVDKILGIKGSKNELVEINKEKKFIATQYTTQARIGIISKGFNSLIEFHDYLLKEFKNIFFNRPEKETDRESFLPDVLSHKMNVAIEELRKKQKKLNGTNKKNLILNLEKLRTDINNKLSEKEIPIKELRRFAKYSDDLATRNYIFDEVLKSRSILIHPLFADEFGIQSIEITEKFSTILDRIKKEYINYLNNKTLSAGILYGKTINYTSFLDIFSNFLIYSSFKDLLSTNLNFISFKEEIKKIRKNKNLIELMFGNQATIDFLSIYKENKILNNFLDFGKFIQDELKIHFPWNPILFEKNKNILFNHLKNIIADLNNFWFVIIKDNIVDEKNEKHLKDNLNILAYEAVFYILFLVLVLDGNFDLGDLESYKEKYNSIRSFLDNKLGVELRQKLEKNHDFQMFLFYTIQLIYGFKNRPINLDYVIEEYKKLDDNEVEKIFQNRVYGFYKPFLGEKIKREPSSQRGKIDFQILQMPIETKIKRVDNKLKWHDFIENNLSQISQYCNNEESDLGFLIIYDNSDVINVEPIIETNIDIYDGKVSEEIRNNSKKPKIIVIRVPNYLKYPSSLK